MIKSNSHKITEKLIKKINIFSILGWPFGTILLLGGFINLFSKPIEGIFAILAGISIFPLFWKVIKQRLKYTVPRTGKIILFIVFFFLFLAVIPENSENTTSATGTTISEKPTLTVTAEAKSNPTSNPSLSPEAKSSPTPNPSLSPLDRAEIIATLTSDLNHFKKIWNDGQISLGSTQYANADEGLAALNDPTSNAYNFSQFKQKEDPAQDSSYMTVMGKINPLINNDNTTNDVAVWSDDMGNLTANMEKWVQDATTYHSHK